MDCPTFLQCVQVYLDDELDARRGKELEKHSSSCYACRERLAEERLLFAALNALPLERAPADFASGVLSVLQLVP